MVDTKGLTVRKLKAPRSEDVEEYGYDAENKWLFVTFKTGDTYKYFGVPQAIYDLLRRARSKGKAVWRDLRGSYRFVKIGRTGWRGPRTQVHRGA